MNRICLLEKLCDIIKLNVDNISFFIGYLLHQDEVLVLPMDWIFHQRGVLECRNELSTFYYIKKYK